MNSFIAELGKTARTWNDAVSNATTGNLCLDYFAKSGSFRGRSQDEVNASMGSIFGENEELAMRLVLYNRMVTRKTALTDKKVTEKVQKGQGQRDEFIKSLIWLENNRPSLLEKNAWLIPVVGCWKDLWYDSASSGLYHYLKTTIAFPLIREGLEDSYMRGLIAKYLPKIRSQSNVKNARHARLNGWAKGLCSYLGWTERQYRKFKSNPQNSAHQFQRHMCESRWDKLNFSSVPGKALFNLTSRRGKDKKTSVERHGQERRYMDWLRKQPTAKFTGYVYELYRAAYSIRTPAQTMTLNKQFKQLLSLADTSSDLVKGGVLCALDTSASMTWFHFGPSKVMPIEICLSLGIYFSSLLKGAFSENVVMFATYSQMLRLRGEFCDKVDQLRSKVVGGSTNFQSVIDEIVRVRRKNPDIPISDYPKTLLVVSDMQFNPAGNEQTNYEVATQKLADVGLPPMRYIWWNVNGRYNANEFASTMNDEGTVLISGFDPTIVDTLLGNDTVVDQQTGEKRKLTPYEQMVKCLDQAVLNKVTI